MPNAIRTVGRNPRVLLMAAAIGLSLAEWATTQWNLGTAYRELGKMEGSRERMEHAERAFRATIEVHTSERNPARWAATQRGLGKVYFILGNMEGSPERVEQALRAYEEALEVYSRECHPDSWSLVQMDLGHAHKRLAEMKNDRGHFKQAISAFDEALATFRPYTTSKKTIDDIRNKRMACEAMLGRLPE